MTVVRLNKETAAASDWQAVTLPVATVLAAAIHLTTYASILPDRAILALGDLARNAESWLGIQRSVVLKGYSPANDDGLEALHGKMLGSLSALQYDIHPDFWSMMNEACQELKEAISERRAAHARQEEPSRARAA